jgi:hypothetical protein
MYTLLTHLHQVYLLAEVLKAAPIPSHVLFQFIRDANIQPRWNDMALPPGMSRLPLRFRNTRSFSQHHTYYHQKKIILTRHRPIGSL